MPKARISHHPASHAFITMHLSQLSIPGDKGVFMYFKLRACVTTERSSPSFLFSEFLCQHVSQ